MKSEGTIPVLFLFLLLVVGGAGRLDVTLAEDKDSPGDEEAICLDYRSSMDKPRVVASCIDNDRIGQWKVIASDIETFTKAIGLD